MKKEPIEINEIYSLIVFDVLNYRKEKKKFMSLIDSNINKEQSVEGVCWV